MIASTDSNALRTMAPLSDEEMDELADFLISDATSDETMVLEVLDGYLTAIVAGPVTVMPSLWLPRIWGAAEEDAPEFENMEQAQHILGLIMRHMNGIVWSLEHDPGAHSPIMSTRVDPKNRREYLDGEMWAYGFMEGVALCCKDWEPLVRDPAGREALRPIHLLGGDDVTAEEMSLIRTPEQRERLTGKIPASIAAIHRFWLPYREAMRERPLVARAGRNQPQIGRNALCPCGSGRKYKKCCGAKASMH